MYRLFAGIDVPDSITQQLLGLCGGVPGARWRRPDQFHLTLRFIGNVDGGTFDDARYALARVGGAALDLQLNGVGNFGEGRRARAIWAGLVENQALAALQARIESALVRAGLDPEPRKFKPHVTVAWLKNPDMDRVRGFLAHNAMFRTEPFRADAFHLYSSQLSHNGSIYRIEESYDLSA
ncbi:MAG: RNA 2',3'-cyclic phosphodiesterase [Alphaproteobacteria bacterium]|nr:RNA 2',3'-cyclic phosphodiesterase [Alphaproteobacteria bacterium]